MRQYLINARIQHRVESIGLMERRFHFFSPDSEPLLIEDNALRFCPSLSIAACNVKAVHCEIVGYLDSQETIIIEIKA
jgi:hypothetical protein